METQHEWQRGSQKKNHHRMTFYKNYALNPPQRVERPTERTSSNFPGFEVPVTLSITVAGRSVSPAHSNIA